MGETSQSTKETLLGRELVLSEYVAPNKKKIDCSCKNCAFRKKVNELQTDCRAPEGAGKDYFGVPPHIVLPEKILIQSAGEKKEVGYFCPFFQPNI